MRRRFFNGYGITLDAPPSANFEPVTLTIAERNAMGIRPPALTIAEQNASGMVPVSAGQIPTSAGRITINASYVDPTRPTNGTLPDGTIMPPSYNPYPTGYGPDGYPLPVAQQAAAPSVFDSIPTWAIVGAAALAALVLLKK